MNTRNILNLCKKIESLRDEQNVYLRTIGEGLLSDEIKKIFYNKVDDITKRIDSCEDSIRNLAK